MRPLTLTMSAFGPYAEKIVLNMDQLGTDGLYLITGETGAGKTTIFDAICYALFGKTSGDSRDESMLRSKYADLDTPTYVELSFRYKDKVYTVRRNPGYLRKRLRGEGTTEEKAAAELHIPGRKVITKISNVNGEIQKILGVDYGQFTKIAMIAQGDFRKLLQANSSQRTEIFSKIFSTGNFGRLQNLLKEEIRKISTELSGQKQKITIYENSVSIAEDDPIIVRWQNRISTEDTMMILKEKIDSDIQIAEQLSDRLQKLENEIRELNSKKQSAEVLKQQQSKMNELQVQLENEKGKLEKLKAEELLAKQHLPEAEKLGEKITTYSNQLSQYELLDTKKKELLKREDVCDKLHEKNERDSAEIEKSENRINQLKQELSELQDAGEKLAVLDSVKQQLAAKEEELQVLRQRWNEYIKKKKVFLDAEKLEAAKKKMEEEEKKVYQKLEEEYKSLDQASTQRERLMNYQKDKEDEKEALQEFKKTYINCSELEKKLLEKQSEYIKKRSVYFDVKAKYESMHRLYLDGQAGLLAESLKEDVPCPVCGSVHHPNLAKMPEEMPKEQELEEAKQKADDAYQIMTDANADAGKILSKLKDQKESLKKQGEKLFDLYDYDQAEDLISQKETEIKKELKTLAVQIDTATKSVNRRKELEESLPKAHDVMETARQEAETARTDCATQKEAYENSYQILKSQAEKLSMEVETKSFREQIINAKENNKKLIEKNARAIEDETARKKKKVSLEELIPEKESALEKSKVQHTESMQIETKQSTEITGLKGNIAELAKTLPFDSKETAQKQLESIRKEKEKIEILAQEATENRSTKENVIEGIRGQITVLQNQIQNMPAVDLDVVENSLNEKENIRKEVNVQKENLNTSLEFNKKAYEGIEEASEKLIKTEHKYQMIKALSDTANGTVTGKEKIMLETFVQMTYFDRIIDLANKRFHVMSNGQYDLIRRERSSNMQSQSGLDLDVVDHYNGSVRPVNSLSGGESFMASLSLALGLSDEIQTSAGGIQLDTMFVDEGFGSLDEETLQLALRALQNLTEGGLRLIGIISHVAELKTRIDKQIVITKPKNGECSKAEIIFQA